MLSQNRVKSALTLTPYTVVHVAPTNLKTHSLKKTIINCLKFVIIANGVTLLSIFISPSCYEIVEMFKNRSQSFSSDSPGCESITIDEVRML